MSAGPDVRIQPVGRDDLARVATIHLAAFPASVLTRLGHEATRRYYEWLLTGPHNCTATAAVVNGRLDAFCFGGTFNGAMTGFLQRNRRYLAVRLLLRPWLVSDPLFRDRLRRATRLLGRARAGARSAAPARPAATSFGVLGLAVDPAARRAGLGRRLMEAMDVAARQQGFTEMDLSVHPDNVGGVAFYERLGWSRVPASGTWTGVMRKQVA
jgi:ribosomal protein S18 acetylase RimI-like enzyme